MSSSNCCFLTCIQVSQEAGQVVWYAHLFQNFPQFIVIWASSEHELQQQNCASFCTKAPELAIPADKEETALPFTTSPWKSHSVSSYSFLFSIGWSCHSLAQIQEGGKADFTFSREERGRICSCVSMRGRGCKEYSRQRVLHVGNTCCGSEVNKFNKLK